MYYFAYGSNLNKQQMSMRCPTATPISTATLKNYRLTERQFADIDKTPDSAVSGALWLILPEDLKALDVYEGYPRFYTRYETAVELENGATVQAIVYEMTSRAKTDRAGLCYSSHYRKTCANGAVDFKIQSNF